MKILKFCMLSMMFWVCVPHKLASAEPKATVLFACIDGYSADRDWSLAETLIQHIMDGCFQCYGTLITNPSISSVCTDSGVPMRNTKNIANWTRVGQKEGITYYLYKSSPNATMGIMSR